MVLRASTESGATFRVAFNNTLPSTTLTGGVGAPGIFCPATTGSTNATFAIAPKTLVTAAMSVSLITTSTGEPSPPGKCLPSSSRPITESVRAVKASVFASPSAFNVNENPAKIVNSRVVEIQIRLGFFQQLYQPCPSAT